MSETIEGHGGVTRVEAFSDGVIAIIVTIMVLELKAPERPGLEHLWPLWPVFLAYILSFIYVGLYWANHHRLFRHARVVSNALIWCNLGLLFALSLIPFSTAYLGEQHFSRDGTIIYMLSMLLPTLFYTPLQRVIHRDGERSQKADTYHRQTGRKGALAVCIYLVGLALAFVSPWLGIACAAAVAILWFLPDSPFDALFGE